MQLVRPDYQLYKQKAGFGIRLLALILDGLVFSAPLLLTWGIDEVFNFFIPEQVVYMAFILYVLLFHWKFGRTFGKYHTDTIVVRKDGSPIGLAQSINRMFFYWIHVFAFALIPILLVQSEAGKHLSPVEVGMYFMGFSVAMAVMFIIDHLFIVFRSDNRALHDLIAGTQVLRK